MGIALFLLFTIVPIAEIYLLIKVGGEIGALPTIGLVLLTAVVGAAMIRHQGIATLTRARTSMEQNIMPVGALFDGLCLLVAGALLLTPGFVTDTFGFLLLVPPFRRIAADLLAARLVGDVEVHVDGPGRSAGGAPHGDGVIDGEFTEVEDEPPEKDRRLLPENARGRGWSKPASPTE